MTYRDAFLHLRYRVLELQRIPVGGQTIAERSEETALIIALNAMRDYSGCFHPSEMIREEVPAERTEFPG